MLDYLRIDHEPEASENGKPPAYWPSSGELRAEKLSARYSDGKNAPLTQLKQLLIRLLKIRLPS